MGRGLLAHLLVRSRQTGMRQSVSQPASQTDTQARMHRRVHTHGHTHTHAHCTPTHAHTPMVPLIPRGPSSTRTHPPTYAPPHPQGLLQQQPGSHRGHRGVCLVQHSLQHAGNGFKQGRTQPLVGAHSAAVTLRSLAAHLDHPDLDHPDHCHQGTSHPSPTHHPHRCADWQPAHREGPRVGV